MGQYEIKIYNRIVSLMKENNISIEELSTVLDCSVEEAEQIIHLTLFTDFVHFDKMAKKLKTTVIALLKN